MSSLRLNRALVLEAPLRVADGAGGFAEGWQMLGTHWAEMRSVAGRAGGGMETETPVVTLRIILRALPPGHALRPVAGQRFRDGGRIYAIGAVMERDGTGRYLLCMAEEVFG